MRLSNRDLDGQILLTIDPQTGAVTMCGCTAAQLAVLYHYFRVGERPPNLPTRPLPELTPEWIRALGGNGYDHLVRDAATQQLWTKPPRKTAKKTLKKRK